MWLMFARCGAENRWEKCGKMPEHCIEKDDE
jgi:hypothetical protein